MTITGILEEVKAPLRKGDLLKENKKRFWRRFEEHESKISVKLSRKMWRELMTKLK